VRGDPVYVRFAAGAGGMQIGRFRKDPDSGTARLVKGARVLVDSATGSGGNTAGIYFSAASERNVPTSFDIPFLHGAIAATTLIKVANARADQYLVIDGVDYDNPTGFAFSAVAYWTVAMQFGAGPTMVASVDTHAVSLPVDTFIALALNNTKANLIVPPGNALTL